MRPIRTMLLAALAALWAGTALACPVCGANAANARTQVAFAQTTALMSLLPLGMIAGGVMWVRRRGKGWISREFEDDDAWSPPGD